MSDDKANLTDLESELTQKIQRHFPRGILPPEVLKKWNECPVYVIVERCIDAFGHFPESVSEPLIEAVGIVEVQATTENFVARDKFVRDTDQNAKVKISYLGATFINNFLGKIERSHTDSILRCGKLRKPSIDSSIMAELGGKDKLETTLAGMFALLERQGDGEKGILLSDGKENVFYIRDANSVLRVVTCDWDRDGWHLRVNSVDEGRERGRGSQVFYPNPSFFSKPRSPDPFSTAEEPAGRPGRKLVIGRSKSGGV